MSKDDATPKKPMTVSEMAQRGGKIGGPARAAKMTPEERSASAQKAAQARWDKYQQRKADKEQS